jgi:IstB-like ATP binding protein
MDCVAPVAPDLEICDARYQVHSTLLTSQLPVASWHPQIGDPTIADSILDRLVHNAHRIELKGESMREKTECENRRRALMNDRCPEGLSRAERGKGAQTPPPRPAPPSPAQQQNH